MSRAVLRELYFGNVCPQEGERRPEKEYSNLREKAYKEYEALKERIKESCPELESRLEVLLDRNTEAAAHESMRAFEDGFRLGARMMLEIFKGD